MAVRFLQLIYMQSSERRIERTRSESKYTERRGIDRKDINTQRRSNTVPWSEAIICVLYETNTNSRSKDHPRC